MNTEKISIDLGKIEIDIWTKQGFCSECPETSIMAIKGKIFL